MPCLFSGGGAKGSQRAADLQPLAHMLGETQHFRPERNLILESLGHLLTAPFSPSRHPAPFSPSRHLWGLGVLRVLQCFPVLKGVTCYLPYYLNQVIRNSIVRKDPASLALNTKQKGTSLTLKNAVVLLTATLNRDLSIG